MDTQSLGRMLTRVRQALLDERVDEGHWQGELSSSALSTATSLVALSLVNQELHRERCQRAVVWLEESQNEDGGWGDTIKSLSNLSTTLLVWAALRQGGGRQERMDRARLWVERQVGGSDPNRIRQAVMDRYGKDRTFSIPIIMMGTICGIFEEDDRQAWSKVWPLPFELAAFPRRWYAALQFPVVSYALPALIAIGYARNYHCPPFFLGRVRQGIWPGVSRLLKEIQPSTGGYLEAAPLTSFVTMALASAGQKEHAVIPEAVRFLENSQREDGSWPIDTNLATWVTTLAIKALGSEHGEASYGEEQQKALRSWLLDQQYRETHPFTGAAPGGWAWTNLAGGVPDADDTPGALLSLALLSAEPNAEDREAAERGCAWLLDLQNRDGGIPTFCRGWGTLPFDRSSPDLTAHTLRAWWQWREEVSMSLKGRMEKGAERAFAFLRREQREDGSWIPLWFGNQYVMGETNATYGTSMVLQALGSTGSWGRDQDDLMSRGVEWLWKAQNDDGSWGGGAGMLPGSVEETALAMEALAKVGRGAAVEACLRAGGGYLERVTKGGEEMEPSPIGFYFAKLWYYERLYPLVWVVGALEAVKKRGIFAGNSVKMVSEEE